MFTLDASTQHNDMRGTIALDWPNVGGDSIDSLAKSIGIDTTKYSPVAFKFSILKKNSGITVYAVEENEERKKFKTLVEFARSRAGNLPVVEFTKDYDFHDFIGMFYHMSIFLNSLHKYVPADSFDIADSVRL
jgi:hypothetical protein